MEKREYTIEQAVEHLHNGGALELETKENINFLKYILLKAGTKSVIEPLGTSNFYFLDGNRKWLDELTTTRDVIKLSEITELAISNHGSIEETDTNDTQCESCQKYFPYSDTVHAEQNFCQECYDILKDNPDFIPEPTNESGGKMAFNTEFVEDCKSHLETYANFLSKIMRTKNGTVYFHQSITQEDINKVLKTISQLSQPTPPTLLNELMEKADKQAIEFAEWIDRNVNGQLYEDWTLNKTVSTAELLQLFHNRDAIIQPNDKPAI